MKSLCFTPFFPKVKLNFVFLYRKLFIFFYDYYAVKGLLMRFAEIFQNILQQSLLLYQFNFSFLEQHHPIVSSQSKITKSYSGIFLVKIVIQYSYKLICLVIQEAKKSQLLSFFFLFFNYPQRRDKILHEKLLIYSSCSTPQCLLFSTGARGVIKIKLHNVIVSSQSKLTKSYPEIYQMRIVMQYSSKLLFM